MTTTTPVRQADRRLALRLALGLVAMFGLAVPFLILALLVRSRWDPLLDLDTTVADRLHQVALHNHWLVTLLQTLSTVFDPLVFRMVATIVALGLLHAGRRRLGAWTLVTTWGAALLGVLLKEVVDRARPDLLDAVATAPGRSFPSGHALGSVVGSAVLLMLAMPLLHRPWRGIAVVAAVIVPLSVGFARIGLGVHYLSDVVAGEVLGLAWVIIMAAAFHAWRRDVGLPPAAPTEAEPEIAEGIPEPAKDSPRP